MKQNGSIRFRFRASLLIGAALACFAGCGGEATPPIGPEATALSLFELADEPDPTDEAIRILFPDTTDADLRAQLFDALAALAEASNPRVEGLLSLDEIEAVSVDLEADLPGGGAGLYSVRMEPLDDVERYSITWFRGPGLEWPVSRAGSGDGISSSAPPE